MIKTHPARAIGIEAGLSGVHRIGEGGLGCHGGDDFKGRCVSFGAIILTKDVCVCVCFVLTQQGSLMCEVLFIISIMF